MRKPKGMHYEEMAPKLLELAREQYETTNNPKDLFRAFCIAYEYGIKLPEWVGDNIYDVFREWIETGNSLDILFKAKISGSGKTSPFNKIKFYDRDLLIMEAVNILNRYAKITIEEATEKTVDILRFLSPPSPAQVAKMYYKDKWHKRLSMIKYSANMITSILSGDQQAIKDAFHIK